jgi:hypothetical protein
VSDNPLPLFLLLGLVFCAAAGVWADDATSPISFDEVAADTGLDFVHRRAVETRLWFPEIMSGGGGWVDYDADGDLDLYLVQGGEIEPSAHAEAPGPGDRLYRNDGATFVDVTEQAIGHQVGYGMGLAVGDYDGDGALDLYVTNLGANVLLRNNGDGTFSDVTAAAGVADPGWGTSAAFFDYDGDGHLDLFVVNYIHWSAGNEINCHATGGEQDYCHPSNYNAPAADVLYRNRGDGTFENVTRAAGIDAFFGNGLGLALADFDGDGRPDLYVANDGMPNQLWLNRDGRRFVNEALLAGAAVNRMGAAEAGMGVAAADLDGDLRTDLFMTHLRDETNTLYLNRGGWFDDVTAGMGLGAPSIGSTGFGTGFADFDQDGILDLLVVNGRVGKGETPRSPTDPFAEPNQLFRGLGRGRFEQLAAGVETPVETSRAAAFGDYDGDGDVDVAVVNNEGPVRLLNNSSDGGAWLRLRALGPHGAPALGARADAAVGDQTQRRQVVSAYSYCAANDPSAHFGLGESSGVERLELRWPDGDRQIWLDVPSSKQLTVYHP